MYQAQQVNDLFTLLSWVVKNGIGVNLVLDMSMVRDQLGKDYPWLGLEGHVMTWRSPRYDFDLYWALTIT